MYAGAGYTPIAEESGDYDLCRKQECARKYTALNNSEHLQC